MFSSRIIPFLFLVATFGLFAFASPIEVPSGLQARAFSDLEARAPFSPVIESSLVTRCDTCTCTTVGCNEEAILEILVNLQLTINATISALDGVTNPSGPAGIIVAAINAAISLLADVQVNVSTAGPLVGQIVNILVAIILVRFSLLYKALAKAVTKYGLVVSVTLSLQFDLALSGLVTAIIKLIPGVTALIDSLLNVDLDLLETVKFVLTIAACAL
ncbi:hypothetical protein HWV62_4295 [Athelia sp. TMB]|nr:hypothetical protein HWV62_4295 [Athelia sp. TMB]